MSHKILRPFIVNYDHLLSVLGYFPLPILFYMIVNYNSWRLFGITLRLKLE